MKKNLVVLIVCALALVLASGCGGKPTPKTACEKISSAIGKDLKLQDCINEYYWPLRKWGATGTVDEQPHTLCYNKVETKADVEACLGKLLDAAKKHYDACIKKCGKNDVCVTNCSKR